MRQDLREFLRAALSHFLDPLPDLRMRNPASSPRNAAVSDLTDEHVAEEEFAIAPYRGSVGLLDQSFVDESLDRSGRVFGFQSLQGSHPERPGPDHRGILERALLGGGQQV